MIAKASLFAVVLAFSMSTSASADHEFEGFEREHQMRQFHQHKAMHGGWHKLRRAFAQLDLSDEQKDALQNLKKSNKQAWRGAHKKMRDFRGQMRQLMHADQVDESAIRQLTAQMAEQRANQILMGLDIRDQAIAILNPEQKAKFDEMRARHKAKREAIREILEE